jgi:hypothetical protein
VKPPSTGLSSPSVWASGSSTSPHTVLKRKISARRAMQVASLGFVAPVMPSSAGKGDGYSHFVWSKRGYGRIGTLLALTFWFWHQAKGECVGP